MDSSSNSLIDSLIAFQSNLAAKTQEHIQEMEEKHEEEREASLKSTMSIFKIMQQSGLKVPNCKYIQSYHFVIRNPHHKYDMKECGFIMGKDSWFNRYHKLVMMYMDAEALNIESIRNDIWCHFLDNDAEWANFLGAATLSHFNEDNTEDYETFAELFGRPLSLRCEQMGMPRAVKPIESKIEFNTNDPYERQMIMDNLQDEYVEQVKLNVQSLRNSYEREYDRICFIREDKLGKKGGLIEAAQNWTNPFFDKGNDPIDNGAKRAVRCDSGDFHNVKHAGGRPVKLDYLKGATNEMVEVALDANGVSRRMKTYYRKRLGTDAIKKAGRPSKYSGKTEEQIIEIMKAEGKSSKVIATQLRRIKMSK